MASKKRKPTSDGLEILYRRNIAGRPEQEAALEAAILNSAIAQEIYDLRAWAGMTQKQLADLVGTTHSVISRLEDADYSGHSLRMLQRISWALKHRVEIHLVPIVKKRRASA